MGVFKLLRVLYVQVLIGIVLGVVVGALWPTLGVDLKPLGDAFVSLIKMAIAPVIFCTIAGGIAKMSDLKAVGRLGAKTLLYFEVVSTLALGLGLLVGEVIKPGAGLNKDPSTISKRPSTVAAWWSICWTLSRRPFLRPSQRGRCSRFC